MYWWMNNNSTMISKQTKTKSSKIASINMWDTASIVLSSTAKKQSYLAEILPRSAEFRRVDID